MITEILTENEEQNCEIRIIVRSDKWGFDNKFWGIQIDNTIHHYIVATVRHNLHLFTNYMADVTDKLVLLSVLVEQTTLYRQRQYS